MLVTSSGTKIRKPHAALRPSPTQILKSSSILSENTVKLRFVAVILRLKAYSDPTVMRLQMAFGIGKAAGLQDRPGLTTGAKKLPPHPEVTLHQRPLGAREIVYHERSNFDCWLLPE